MLKRQKLLIGLAIAISIILCIELAIRGYNFHNGVLSKTLGNQQSFVSNFDRFRVGIEYLALNVLYLSWMLQNSLYGKYFRFTEILQKSSLFIVFAFIGYPITTDIILYLQYGLMSLKGVNPFITGAGEFNTTIFSFIVWEQSSTYGPVALIFFILSALLVPTSLFLSIYVFKLLCVIFHILNGYLIWYELKAKPYQSWVTLAYLISPFILFEQVVNAHIDVLISTILIILVLCIKYRHYLTGVLVIWVGVFTKTLPIVWLPLVAVLLLKKQRWKSIAIATCLSMAICLAMYFTILPTALAWKSLLNPGVVGRASGSLHSLLDAALQLSIIPNSLAQLRWAIVKGFTLIAYAGFVAYYVWSLAKIYFKAGKAEPNLSLIIGWVTLVLFLFATPWYRPWYATVLFPVMALNINSQLFVLTSITFCLCSSCSYYLLSANDIFNVLTVVPSMLILLLGKKIIPPRGAEV